MSSIRISEKHGVNPTICNCFFCGEAKHIALMGKLKGDVEAPHSCVMDYEPCDKCQEKMSLGVTLIEVFDVQPADGRPALKAQEGIEVYPLGGWAVVKAEAFSQMTNQQWSAGQKVFVDSEVLKHITGGTE